MKSIDGRSFPSRIEKEVLFPDRDFLSSGWDKLSHLFEYLYLLKSWAHLGFGWICCYLNYSRTMAGAVGRLE